MVYFTPRQQTAANLGDEMKYQLINIRTGAVVGTYSSKQRARNSLDRKDNEYGAYVHRIVEVQA